MADYKVGDDLKIEADSSVGRDVSYQMVKSIEVDEVVFEVKSKFTKYLIDKDGLNVRDKNGNCVVDYEETRLSESRMPKALADTLEVKPADAASVDEVKPL